MPIPFDDQTLVGVDPQEKPNGKDLYVEHIRQPLPFLNPTGASFTSPNPAIPNFSWSSRSSRKNRSPETIQSFAPHHNENANVLPIAATARVQYLPFKPHLVADCSFWVAMIFTIGSAIWVANGFLYLLPLVNPNYPLYGTAASALAFVGGTLFEFGSYLMVVEALNTGHEEMWRGPLSGLLRWNKDKPADHLEKGLISVQPTRRDEFHWWGPAHWRELGYLASFIQLIAASVFWIATISGLPDVIPGLGIDPPVAVTDVFFWTPQVVGGFGFIVSSLLLMIETQKRWYLPNLTSVGWHIGFWNLVGAVGFLLSGAFGYLSLESSWQNYESVLTTFWGSWAFLIGSVIQAYETLWREPVSSNTPTAH